MPYAIALLAFLTACSTSTGPDDNQSLCSNIPNTICTYAGTGDAGFNGDGRPLLASTLYWPIDLTITPTGTTYILDWNTHRVRRGDPDSTLTTVIGTDFVGDGPYDQSALTAPGAAGPTVHLNPPPHLLPLADGGLLLPPGAQVALFQQCNIICAPPLLPLLPILPQLKTWPQLKT